MKTHTIGVLAALVAPSCALADQLYTGTWDISGQAAGTVTLRVRDNGVVTGHLIGSTGRRTSGHFRGTYEGKRFKVILRLPTKGGQEFQGNFTRNDEEAHMDGLKYVDNKPVDDVRLTLNAITVRTLLSVPNRRTG